MEPTNSKVVTFQPSGRGKAQCAPNPLYPEGIAVDVSRGAKLTCLVPLPYPAPECGMYLVRCLICDNSVALTVAGRPDDPVSIRLPCLIPEKNQ